jgi:glycosyltransferase involved in cell wall biosynthesis
MQPQSDSAEKGADERVVESPGSNLRSPGSSHDRPLSPTILYCGNFGNMHDSETLFGYWKSRSAQLQQASPPEVSSSRSHAVHWRFHCSGPKRAALADLLSQLPAPVRATITLEGGLNQPDWINVMRKAEIALVTMAPGSETVVMPSKAYSAMMAGQALLAIAPEASDLVDLIRRADCGWWVAPDDLEALATTLETIASNLEAVLEKRVHAYRYAQSYLSQDALAADWIRALDPIATSEGTHRPPPAP